MKEYTVKGTDFSEYDSDKALILDKIDRNGTHYYTDPRCPKCGGTGYIPGYEHVEGGRCFLCGGSGRHGHQFLVRTEAYAKKLADARLERAKKGAAERNAKFLADQGFNQEGETWIAMGNTYQVKEQLKAAGAKYNDLFGWHFDHDTADFPVVKITINDEVPCMVQKFQDENDWSGEWVDGTVKIGEYNCEGTLSFWEFNAIENYIKSLREQWVVDHAPKTEHYGNIGDKVQLDVKCTRIGGYDSDWGYVTIFTFEDAEGHNFVWKTSSYVEIDKGAQLKLKGTVKEHTEYKGIKQTNLTRCKVVA